ncbi:membrane protein FxsA [Bacillus sp. FJAT-29790]|uniref:FxsA family protein n=1 Tax=Bacillus sp. FJAT-29790 TaxID=1895002 RepID=UPI001C2290B9|nr:FxsA family protein [Bacillus sp. FJAT-29790]MBU8879682.1 membrane protein FxsA [Bacillus sp. FJAT-29790]
MRYILLLLIIVPAVEISVLLLSGKLIGVWPTVGIIIFTGFLGAYLAKKQGLEMIKKTQEQLRFGQMPGESIIDGICILIGGILLLLPGFITDVTGLLLLAPAPRRFFKKRIKVGLQRWMDRRNYTIIR